ncbi:hypothetical protein [Tolypothrix sp. FACHB-123]|uniref:hypothetical protein n=1 Tax=Tolypothrix sp. FACHB-123 TaxID=2692868 RepID=UPI001F54CA29|nr:hypothetical protein [Tolypothrix sp. FACHB-123]
MKYNPDKHHRRSIRLPGYDYTQAGMYFITLCIWQRECLLGEVLGAGSQRLSNINDDINEPAPTYIELSRYGQVVQYN